MKKSTVVLFLQLILGISLLIMQNRVHFVADGSLTSDEDKVLELVNGTEAYSYGKHLEDIAFSHFAFRSAGSIGANETADWIAEQFSSFGLDTMEEAFEFKTWDLLSKPTLVIDEDGNPSTISDQTAIQSFQCEHFSWPGDVFQDLVVLPLPAASDQSQIGAIPIGTMWNSINTTGKVVLVGREVRLHNEWHTTFTNKLRAQPPAAVIHTWWYEFMSFVPDFFSSTGGRPVQYAHYFWQLSVPVGFVSYSDGILIRNKENSLDVSAKVSVDAVVGDGPHYNVVGKLPGYGEPQKTVIIMGHYDSVTCAGFCDNGAGAAGVIELAHVFTEAAKKGLYYPKYSMLFIGLAAEEMGLVGSIHYVSQHRDEMENVIAVINLDCIGSDVLEVTETELDHDIDLDQMVVDAAADLGLSTTVIAPFQADETPFLSPSYGDGTLMFWWDMSLGLGNVHPVGPTVMISSSPLIYREIWDPAIGKAGWIHTSYDNSTSSGALSWVELDDLEAHVKVAALAVMRIAPSSSVLTSDLNKDGKVNILDVTIVATAFGTVPGDATWNETADIDKNGTVNIIDISVIAKDFGKGF